MKNTTFLLLSLGILSACGDSPAENHPGETTAPQESAESSKEPSENLYKRADSWENTAMYTADTYCACVDSTGNVEDCYWEFSEAVDAVDSLEQIADELGEAYNADYKKRIDQVSEQIESCQMSGLVQDRTEEVLGQ